MDWCMHLCCVSPSPRPFPPGPRTHPEPSHHPASTLPAPRSAQHPNRRRPQDAKAVAGWPQAGDSDLQTYSELHAQVRQLLAASLPSAGAAGAHGGSAGGAAVLAPAAAEAADAGGDAAAGAGAASAAVSGGPPSAARQAELEAAAVAEERRAELAGEQLLAVTKVVADVQDVSDVESEDENDGWVRAWCGRLGRGWRRAMHACVLLRVAG